MMRQYPCLFPDEHHVLHQLFFVNGNGWYWIEGELIDPWERPDEELFADHAVYHLRLLADYDMEEYTAFKGVVDSLGPAEAGRMLADLGREDGKKNPLDWDNYGIYPLCEYAKIANLPDDIKPDWLQAARRALDWARTVKTTESDKQWLEKAEMRLFELKQKEVQNEVRS
jgi:hypothetical protein